MTALLEIAVAVIFVLQFLLNRQQIRFNKTQTDINERQIQINRLQMEHNRTLNQRITTLEQFYLASAQSSWQEPPAGGSPQAK